MQENAARGQTCARKARCEWQAASLALPQSSCVGPRLSYFSDYVAEGFAATATWFVTIKPEPSGLAYARFTSCSATSATGDEACAVFSAQSLKVDPTALDAVEHFESGLGPGSALGLKRHSAGARQRALGATPRLLNVLRSRHPRRSRGRPVRDRA
jgi:hypothetical protein